MTGDLGPFPVTITTPAGRYAVTVQHETLDLTNGDATALSRYGWAVLYDGDAIVCGAESPLAALDAAQGKLRSVEVGA